jgi:hypothetical protein
VSSGNGKCCAADDFSSDGCDPIGVHEKKLDGQTLELVCGSNPSIINEKVTYSGESGSQAVTPDSSHAYEICPHYPD